MVLASLGVRPSFALLLFAFLASCRAPLPAKGDEKPALEPKTIEISEGVLLQGCTPTGVEVCFNATDDNCNGVIDEGCGIPTGLLQFAIAWESGPDVDLIVTDPMGEVARPGDTTSGGLLKDRDCGAKAGGCQGRNLENVHYEGSSPPKGRYEVEVKLEYAAAEHLPVQVRLGARIGARTYALEIELREPGESQYFAFSL